MFAHFPLWTTPQYFWSFADNYQVTNFCWLCCNYHMCYCCYCYHSTYQHSYILIIYTTEQKFRVLCSTDIILLEWETFWVLQVLIPVLNTTVGYRSISGHRYHMTAHINFYEVTTDPTSRRLILSAWLEFRPVTWSSIFVHSSSSQVSTKHGKVMAGRPIRARAVSSCTKFMCFPVICFPIKVVSLFKLYTYMWALVCFPYKF